MDIKKTVTFPRVLYEKVGFDDITKIICIFFQIFENVGYKNSNGVTIEPLHSNDCQVNYDNVETYRPEVSYGFFCEF